LGAKVNPVETVALAALGIVELALRIMSILLLVATIIGSIVVIELAEQRKLRHFLQPWCFEHISNVWHRQSIAEPKLTRRQQRNLEYERQHLQILQRTKQLEDELRSSPLL
jgi:hypothetical protein